MAKTYIGLHPNDLNRTDYGQVVLYVEGQPVAYFSGSGDVTISGSLYADNIPGNFLTQVSWSQILQKPELYSSSAQIQALGFITASDWNFITNKPTLYSSSAQIQALGFITASAWDLITGKPVLYSSSAQIQALGFITSSDWNSITNKPTLYSSSAQIYNSGFITSSNQGITQIQNLGFFTASFDGNRPVTQPLLPDLVAYNPGTSTVVDFLNQVFYPDPGFGIEITSNEPFAILESARSGSQVNANSTGVVGTQAGFTANTAVTWSLQSNSALAINSSTGRLTIKVDFSGSATYQAPASVAGTVIATAPGGYKTRPFTVTIVDNLPATITTSGLTTTINNQFTTASRNYGTVVITDTQADANGAPSITTLGGVSSSLFTLVSSSATATSRTYFLSASQALNSGSYPLEFTGSDAYANVSSASFTLTVEQNLPLTLSVYSGFSSSINDATSGSIYGQVRVTDPQAIGTITSFSLTGSDASKFTTTLGGFLTGNYDARYVVFAAQNLTSGSYNITASAQDTFGNVTLFPIPNQVYVQAPGVFVSNGAFFAIESAVSGAFVTTATSGIPGTQARLTTNQSVSWSLDDPTGNLFISGSTVGFLSLVGNLSGSAYQNGNILTADVTATNPFGLSRTQTINVSITDNLPATISISAVSKNNYFTVSGRQAGFGTVTVADPQSFENVRLIGLGGPNGSSFFTSSASPGQTVVYLISSSVNLNSGSYVVGFTASDAYGQLTYTTQSYTVTPNNPPLIGTTTFTKDISLSTSGSTIGQLSVSDGDAIEGIASTTLSGSDATKFQLVDVFGTTTKIYDIRATQDLTAGGYNVTASAVDNFGNILVQPLEITITVQAPSIPTANGLFYIIESAVSGSDVTTASSGIAGTKAKFTTNQSVTWSLQSGAVLAISQSGELSIKIPMSGSATYLPGSIIADRVIATNQFSASENFDFQVVVTDDLPPTISSTIADKNNNKTLTATGFGTITVSDPQALGNVSITAFNGPNVGDFTFTPGPAGSTRVYTVSSSAALNSGSYNFSVTASDAYAQTFPQAFLITVIQNLAPTVTLSGFSRSVSQATSGSIIGTASIVDPQDDSIASFTLSGTDSTKFATSLASSTATSAIYYVSTTQNLATGSYNLTGSATDSFGLTTVTPIPVTISAIAPAIPLQNAANFYIIESALSGSNVVVNSDGFTGTQADMNTDQVVTWSISPGTFLAIDSSGGLSAKVNISGSSRNASGPPFNLISETVIATNAFGDSSQRVIDVQVAANSAPVLTYSGLTVNEGSADAGDTVGKVTATDPQSLDSITSVIISGGTNAGNFELVLSGSTAYSKTYDINVSGSNLAAGSYSIQLTGRDSFNKTTVETKTVTVNAVTATNTVYVYGSTRSATSINNEVQAIGALGDPGADELSIVANSPIARFISGSIGSGSISVTSGTVTLIKTGSLPTLTDLNTLGNLNFSAAIQQIIILFPSGSTLGAQPSSMYDATLPAASPVAKRYALYDANPTIPGPVGSGVYYFNLLAAKDGYSRWGMIFSESGNQNNAPFYIIPDSGSAPI